LADGVALAENKLIVREQVDGAPTGAREQVGERVHLVRRCFEKKRLAAVLISTSESPTDTMALASTRTLMGRGVPTSSTSAGLVGDVEVDVDHLARDRRARGEQRNLLGLSRGHDT
jgi:hypothetical protein